MMMAEKETPHLQKSKRQPSLAPGRVPALDEKGDGGSSGGGGGGGSSGGSSGGEGRAIAWHLPPEGDGW